MVLTKRSAASGDENAWINTIALRDQFKPIRTGENLVVKYNVLQKYFFDQSARLFSKLRVFSNVLYCVILYYFVVSHSKIQYLSLNQGRFSEHVVN